MAKATKILLATVMISMIGLISSINPSSSHDGHNKSLKTEEKQKLIKKQESSLSPEMHEDMRMSSQTSNPDETQVIPDAEKLVKSPSQMTFKLSNLIPQLPELLFFLLLASPYLLHIYRYKIHQKRAN